jgi:NAD(P)-dependent dehydrogenase (short-subunit alcohol dehydrogenase family)
LAIVATVAETLLVFSLSRLENSHHCLLSGVLSTPSSKEVLSYAGRRESDEEARRWRDCHTGSIWALQAIGATPSSAYSAANAGVHALVHNLALELAGDKIRINAVARAFVETPLDSTFMTKEQVQKTLPNFNAFHPLRRNG